MNKLTSTYQADAETKQLQQKGFVVKPAQDFMQFYQACRLVYDEYHAAGLCESHPSRLRFYLRELLPESTTFVLVHKQRVIASITGIRWSVASLPAYSVYKSEIDLITQSSKLFVEATKFASVARKIPGLALSRDPLVVLESLLGILFHWSGCVGADYWLSVVHPKQVSYYTKKFGFKVVGREKSCDHVSNKPGVLIQMNVREILKGRAHVKPYFNNKVLFPYPAISQVQNYHFLSAVEILFLLLEQPEVLEQASPDELKIFNFYYPNVAKAVQGYFKKYVYDSSKNLIDVEALYESLKVLFTIEDLQDTTTVKGINEYRVFETLAFFDYLNLVGAAYCQIHNKNFELKIVPELPKQVCGKKYVLLAIFAQIVLLTNDNCLISLSAFKRKHNSIFLKFQYLSKTGAISDRLYQLIAMVQVSIWRTQSLASDGNPGEWTIKFTFPFLDLGQENLDISTFNAGQKLKTIMHKAPSILVAQANPVERSVLLRILKSRGYNLRFANNGTEALECIRSEEFDLLIIDSALPEVDGLSVARFIKMQNNNRKIPLLMLTAWFSEQEQISYQALMIDELIKKPIVLSDFYQRIDYHLARSYINSEKPHLFRVA